MEAGREGRRGTWQHVDAPERVRRCTHRNNNRSHCTGRVGTIKANEAEALFDKITDYDGNEKLSKWCGRLRFNWPGWKLVLNDLKSLQSILPMLADNRLGQHHRTVAYKTLPPSLARSDQRRPPRYSRCYHQRAKRASIRMLIFSFACWSTLWSLKWKSVPEILVCSGSIIDKGWNYFVSNMGAHQLKEWRSARDMRFLKSGYIHQLPSESYMLLWALPGV